MNATLYHGLSGIKTHQFGVDSMSNNIANINTDGYRGNTPIFKSLFSKQLDSINAGKPVNSDFNVGVTVASNAIDTSSGVYRDDAESPFNIALGGSGWFVVGTNENGSFDLASTEPPTTQKNYFTRAGGFKRNSEGYIVNDEGFYLYGIDLGKINRDTFESSNDKAADLAALKGTGLVPLRLPEGIVFHPTVTTKTTISINLSKRDNLTSPEKAFKDSTGTFINNFKQSNFNTLYTSDGKYIDPTHDSTVNISVYDSSGSATTVSLVYGRDFNTVGEFLTALEGVFADSTGTSAIDAEISESCDITITNNSGRSIELEITSASSFAKMLDLASTRTVIGATVPANTIYSKGLTIPRYETSVEIYDDGGEKYLLKSSYVLRNYGDPDKVPPIAERWEMSSAIYTLNDNIRISSQEYKGTMLYDANGKPTYISGAYDSTATAATSQTETIDFLGGSVTFNPIGDSASIGASTNHVYTDSKLRGADKDGNERGTLAAVGIDRNGFINLQFTNDKSEVMGRVAVTDFVNPHGLSKAGSSRFEITYQEGGAVSGLPILMWDNTYGTIDGSYMMQGKLEGSNVDFGVAMTELIIMQRGYSANSKSFTTADDLLKEAIAMKR